MAVRGSDGGPLVGLDTVGGKPVPAIVQTQREAHLRVSIARLGCLAHAVGPDLFLLGSVGDVTRNPSLLSAGLDSQAQVVGPNDGLPDGVADGTGSPSLLWRRLQLEEVSCPRGGGGDKPAGD